MIEGEACGAAGAPIDGSPDEGGGEGAQHKDHFMRSKELSAYRSRLLAMRERLIAEVQATEERIREDIVPPGEHVASSMHPGDQPTEGLHENIAIAQNEEHLLEDVEAALTRIDSGKFGVCQECGRHVGHQRLDAIPYTAWCIDCARQQERPAPPG
jgi:RNA polymerase-binding protein DksA